MTKTRERSGAFAYRAGDGHIHDWAGTAIDGASFMVSTRWRRSRRRGCAGRYNEHFNGTNVGANAFGSAAYTCSTTDSLTCVHARKRFGDVG
jgi:hypothetical protein